MKRSPLLPAVLLALLTATAAVAQDAPSPRLKLIFVERFRFEGLGQRRQPGRRLE